MEQTVTLLSMRSITKFYGAVKALDGGAIEVKKGEVHALLGANGAGKSTLMKVLCGEIPFDGGDIFFDGKPLEPGKYRNSLEYGIGMIHQELSTVGDLTVSQYMFLGREPMRGFAIDDSKMELDAVELLKPMAAEFSPTAMMSELSLAQQQLVELSKSLSYDIKLLVLDEPTTALGDAETKRLFSIIRSLAAKGISVIYISHRLEELLEISQRVTIMRDGKYIKTINTAETDKAELIRLLAGRELKILKKEKSSVPADAPVVLEVRGLCTDAMLHDVGFKLHRGELLGFAGLMGSGRTETARAICGIDRRSAGDVLINGELVQIQSPKEAMEHGICYLSEDRNAEGQVPRRSIITNTVLSSLERYEKKAKLDNEHILNDAVEYNRRMNTRYSDPHQDISSLSGGNVQKVIIARWLLRDLPVMIFDEPTKGIDVGARDEIYAIIREIVANGHSVIMISSDTEELLSNCDRILVMAEGRITGELDIADATPQKIMTCAMEGKHV